MRTVIFHYHLFKNAGTSIDETLKRNFPGDGWVTKEFPAHPQKNHQELISWIKEKRNAICFSSHTAMLPPPAIEDVRVFPVIFVRHPLDRIVSAYAFERKQNIQGFGAVLARNTSLAGYIETRLALPGDRQCRNFHVHRFAHYARDDSKIELQRAAAALEELPFVGIVEEFSKSLNCLQEILINEGFEGVKLESIRRNVSKSTQLSLEDKIAIMRAKIGESLYAKVEDANREDLTFYDKAKEIFESKCARLSRLTS